MISAILGLLLAAAPAFAATPTLCDQQGSGLQLCVPRIGTGFDHWSRATVDAFNKVNSSAAVLSTTSVHTANWLRVERISGLDSGPGLIRVSSSIYMTDGSTLSVGGNAFSVGGSTLVVSGGTTTINRLQLNNALAVPYGGTARTSLDANALIVGAGTSAPVSLPVMGNGGLAIGTGGTPSTGTIAGTANRVSVTNGAGTITLSAPQDLHSGATPSFAGATLTGNLSGTTAGFSGSLTAATATITGSGFSVGGSTLIVQNGGVGIGTTSVPSAAVLFTSGVTRGVLFNPMTQAQRDAIASPPAGLIVFNTGVNKYNSFNGSAWEALGGGGHVFSTATISGSTATGAVQLPQRSTAAFDSAGFELVDDPTTNSTIIKSKGYQYLASTTVYMASGATGQNSTDPTQCVSGSTATITTGNNKVYVSIGAGGVPNQQWNGNILVDGQRLPGYSAGPLCSGFGTGTTVSGIACSAITPTLSAGTHNICFAFGYTPAPNFYAGFGTSPSMSVFELNTGGSGFAAPASSATTISFPADVTFTNTAWLTSVLNSTLTLTASGAPLMINFDCSVTNDSDGQPVNLGVLVNGQYIDGESATTGFFEMDPVGASSRGSYAGFHHLTQGSFTGRTSVTLIAKVMGGTGRFRSSSTFGNKCDFSIQEVRNAPGTGDVSSNGSNRFSGLNSFTATTSTAPQPNTVYASAIVKAWASFAGTSCTGGGGSDCAIHDGLNIDHITRTTTGTYDVYWRTPFASTRYSVTGSCQRTDTIASIMFQIGRGTTSNPFTTTTARIGCGNYDGNSIDGGLINIQVVGAQ